MGDLQGCVRCLIGGANPNGIERRDADNVDMNDNDRDGGVDTSLNPLACAGNNNHLGVVG